MTRRPDLDSVLLRGAVVFDGEHVVGTSDVLVREGRIAAVGRDLSPDDATVLDCRDHTLLPGLIDAHVHLAWAGLDPPAQDVATSRARTSTNDGLLLRAGVTTVRDTGGPLEVLSAVADDINSGQATGPDVLYCGRILCAPGGHGTEISVPVTIARECTGPDGFRAGVREQLAGGARFVKVALNGASGDVELSEEELRAVVDETHSAGARVACHASVRAAVEIAVECGVDTIEHGNGLDARLAPTMATKGIALVPTVAIFAELEDRLATVGDDLLTPDQVAAHRCAATQRVQEHGPALAAARTHGVRLGLGSDRVPGGEVVAVRAEAQALQRHGLAVTEVLHAATAGNAELLGLDDRGRIRVGARADIAVFRGDVTSDLDLLGTPAVVFQAGRRMTNLSGAGVQLVG